MISSERRQRVMRAGLTSAWPGLTLGLIVGLILGLILVMTGVAAADVVVLKDGRRITGEVVKATDDVVVVKKTYGEVTFKRSEVASIERSDGAGAGVSGTTGAAKTARRVFRNGFYNYEVTRPESGWIFKKSPPEPLTDLIVYQPKLDAELAVIVLPDEQPKLSLDKVALASFSKNTRAKISERFSRVKELESKAGKVAGVTAFTSRFQGISKLSRRSFVIESVVFKARERVYSLLCGAPEDSWKAAEEELAAMVASFKLVDVKDLDEGVYSNFELFYRQPCPDGWTLKRQSAGSTVSSPDGRLAFQVEVGPRGELATLAACGEALVKRLEGSVEGFKLGRGQARNLGGTIAHELLWESRDSAGTQRHSTLLIGTRTRLYTVSIAWPSSAPELEKRGAELLEDFDAQRDFGAKTGIEAGLKAIAHSDAGYKALLANDFKTAAKAYERAIEVFPNFATALNNLGLCEGRLGDPRAATVHGREAWRLFPERDLFRANLAVAYANYGNALLEQKETKEGESYLKRALKLDPENATVRSNLAIAIFNRGIGNLNKRRFSVAARLLKEAEELDPKNVSIRKARSQALTSMAVDAANRGRKSKARRYLREALKADPGNSQARSLQGKLK